MNIVINNNLENGDCGLWYDVVVKYRDKIIHCVCPYYLCKSFEEAISFYLKHFHKQDYIPQYIHHHKVSKTDLEYLSIAC